MEQHRLRPPSLSITKLCALSCLHMQTARVVELAPPTSAPSSPRTPIHARRARPSSGKPGLPSTHTQDEHLWGGGPGAPRGFSLLTQGLPCKAVLMKWEWLLMVSHLASTSSWALSTASAAASMGITDGGGKEPFQPCPVHAQCSRMQYRSVKHSEWKQKYYFPQLHLVFSHLLSQLCS